MNKLIQFLFILVVISIKSNSAIYAQTSISNEDTTGIEALKSFLSKENLKSHVYYLSSDELKGRNMDQGGDLLASKYIQKHFNQLELMPLNGVRVQNFKIYNPRHTKFLLSNENAAISLNNIEPLFGGEDFKGQIKLHYIDEFTYDNIYGRKVRNEGVVFHKNDIFNEGNVKLEDSDSRLIIRVYDNDADFKFRMFRRNEILSYVRFFEPRDFRGDHHYVSMTWPNLLSLFSSDQQKKISQYQTLKRKEKKQLYTTVNAELVYKTLEFNNENVLGYIEGTSEKDQFIVVSAHYDHLGEFKGVIYNGANDNASGTASMMELARVFKKLEKEGISPKKSIVFMAFSAEESGLLGSEYFCDNPIVPLNSIVANINLDMVGKVDSTHFENRFYTHLLGIEKHSSGWESFCKETAQNLTPNLSIILDDKERLYYRSDQYNFGKRGIPVALITDKSKADYHLPSDDADKLDYDVMYERTKLAMMLIWKASNHNKSFSIDRFVDENE